MKHWAYPIRTEQWPAGGCWSFVRSVLQRRGVTPPPALGDGMQHVTHGWRKVNEPRELDVFVCAGPGGRHAGLVVESDGVAVLHAHGDVMVETLAEFAARGYGHFEFWRRAA